MTLVLLAHVAATWMMVGLIWFVQVVHYPLFDRVGKNMFAVYEAAHTRLTTWVVGPPMLVEAVTTFFLVWRRPDGISPSQVWLGATLLAGIWLSMAFLQVPQHTLLALGFDASAHRTLIISNWLRTLAWSVRGLVVFWMLGRMIYIQ